MVIITGRKALGQHTDTFLRPNVSAVVFRTVHQYFDNTRMTRSAEEDSPTNAKPLPTRNAQRTLIAAPPALNQISRVMHTNFTKIPRS